MPCGLFPIAQRCGPGIKGQIEVALTDKRDAPLFTIGEDAFPRISGRLLLKGEDDRRWSN